MPNERKTEDFVRKHFAKFADLTIEEQQSENTKIQKLLKNASKKGSNVGRPEFIIRVNKNAELIIVIECKGNSSKHKSRTLDKYGDYAVDGALLYAAFLSKEFDVIAIGVSGQTAREMKVSHYLQLKGANNAVSIFPDKLQLPETYLTGYLQSPEKFRQDYNSLLSFSKDLNETLHAKKIKESQRSLLISGILIALENKAFEVSYKQHLKPEDLANILADTISYQLKNANLHSKKLDNLRNAYNFIRTHTSLSSEDNVLSDLIDSIDRSINKFLKTHKYFDVLGQFYIEFLRYANSDKGLGIVLTPPHTTQLFTELAGVNKDSIVYDNCTGTGGFLISAMSRMIEDARGDTRKIRSIKEKQLIGVEWQDDIFALACSNMFIHGDGKTNIIHGNCFDPSVNAIVREYKPNIGFLNPPYKTKKTDKEELDFVLNNLEMLAPNGTCVAIIPISSVLQQKGPSFELKEKILENHTLEAVFSMPDELFINSDVGVITCVVVLTAHKPHSKKKETYFGYWKVDGFIKTKTKGRIDARNQWDDIKARWLHSYTNRKNQPGLSVSKCVTAQDEWCAEAYMETDYSSLNSNDFIKSIKKYILFKQLSSADEKSSLT